MLIRDVMQTTLVTVAPDTMLPEAARLVSQRGIRHLLVVEGGQLVGIVSDRDLKRAMASSATTLEAQRSQAEAAAAAIEEYRAKHS